MTLTKVIAFVVLDILYNFVFITNCTKIHSSSSVIGSIKKSISLNSIKPITYPY